MIVYYNKAVVTLYKPKIVKSLSNKIFCKVYATNMSLVIMAYGRL